MGNLKDKALNNDNAAPASEDTQQHKLNADEAGYLTLLNIALQYHTLGQKIMTGFLYYVCTHRLGYKDGVNLQFKYDFNSEDHMLEVTLLPETLTQEPTPPAPAAPEA